MLSERRYWPQEDGETYVKAAIARSRTNMPACVANAIAEINRRLDELAQNRSDIELDQESRVTRTTTKVTDDNATLKTSVQAACTLLADLNGKYDAMYEEIMDCEEDILKITSKLGLDLSSVERCVRTHSGYLLF